jgi:hypothetical protein
VYLPPLASRRLRAACTASLLVLPLLAGCSHRGDRCSDATPVDERFWEISDQRRQLIAETRKVQATETPAATVAQSGTTTAGERVATTVDPFLTAEEVAKPVTQVAAREAAKPQQETGSLADFDEFDRAMESLRRDARPTRTDAEPSLEWADEAARSTNVDGAAAADVPSQFDEKFDPSEFAVEEPGAASVAEELMDGPIEAGATASHPLDEAGAPATSPVPVREIPDTPPVVEPKRPAVEREPAVKPVDPSLIVDTIQIRPRGYRDAETLANRIAMIDATVTPPVATPPVAAPPVATPPVTPTPEVPAAVAPTPVAPPATAAVDERLWSEETTATLPARREAVEVAMAVPVAPPTVTTSPVETPVAIDDPASEASQNPLLVAPNYVVERGPVQESGPMLVQPMPVLATPTAAPDAAVAPATDPFRPAPPPSTIASLQSLDFPADDPATAAPAASNSTAWWFGGLAIGGLLLLFRARKRLLA